MSKNSPATPVAARRGHRMGNLELALFATLWTMVSWMGMDMYLPALPIMDDALGCSEALVNMTLVAFQLFFALGALIGGTLSDRFGRRSTMLFGGGVFLGFSIVSALAPNVWLLGFSRALAGGGAGFCSAVAMAVLKDRLEGAELDKAITISQTFVVVGPIFAPLLGSLMIEFTSWRGIFALLCLMIVPMLLWVLRMEETLPLEKRNPDAGLRSLKPIFMLLKDVPFTLLLIALSMAAFSFGVYMTLGSYIIVEGYGLSNMGYSLCYGLTTLFAMIGPSVFLALSQRWSKRRVTVFIPLILALSGALMLLNAGLGGGIVCFQLCCFVFVMAEAMSRPCAYLVLLGNADKNVGAVSSLIGFSISTLTALATPFASLNWPSHLWGMSWLLFLAGLFALGLIYILLRVLKSKILD